MRRFSASLMAGIVAFPAAAAAQSDELPIVEMTRYSIDWAEICPAPEGYGQPCIGLTRYQNPTCAVGDYCGAEMMPFASVLDYVDEVPADRPLAYSLRRFNDRAGDYDGVFCLIERRPAITLKRCAWVSEAKG